MTDTIANNEVLIAGNRMPQSLPPLTPNASLRWDVLARVLPDDCGTLLEVGCGKGAAAARIAKRATRMVAVEPDAKSFAAAQANLGTEVELHNCSSEQIPQSEKFDTICSFDVLEHIEDDKATLLEWRRKLKDGGLLVISVPAWADRLAAADVLVGHFRRYDPSDIQALLAEAGFTDITVELYGYPFGYLLEAIRNFIAQRRLNAGARKMEIADRTAGSGRLLQPTAGLTGALVAIAARPMVWIQRLFPNRGAGLVATARSPQ